MFNFDLEKAVKETFGVIIQQYGFIIAPIDDTEILLVKSDFGLLASISYDGADVLYVTKKNNGQYVMYWLSFYADEKFDHVDREQYGDVNNLSEKFTASFRVIASGLQRHWSNILEGDKDWIQDYLKHGGDEESLNAPTLDFVKKYF